MLCGLCNEREATVHLTQILGEKMQKVDLCEQCAKEKGVNDPDALGLADSLLGLGASHEMEEASGDTQLKCPVCGFTQDDFKKTGRLGCPDCYETFASGLESVLKTMHKGTHHVGKTPQALREKAGMKERLRNLEKELDELIESEQFEQAAIVRDDIKRLTAELKEATSTP